MRYLHSSVSTLRHSTIFLIFLEVSFLFLFWGVWEGRSWFYWMERLRSVGVSASNDLSALADGVLRAAEGPGAAFFAWGGGSGGIIITNSERRIFRLNFAQHRMRS